MDIECSATIKPTLKADIGQGMLCTFAADSNSLIKVLRAYCSGFPLFLRAIILPPK